jgi:hypothetical protein
MIRSAILLAIASCLSADEGFLTCEAPGDPNPPPDSINEVDGDYVSYYFRFVGGSDANGTSPDASIEIEIDGHSLLINGSCLDDFAGLDRISGTGDDGYGSTGDPSEAEGHPRLTAFGIFRYSRSVEHCELVANCSSEFVFDSSDPTAPPNRPESQPVPPPPTRPEEGSTSPPTKQPVSNQDWTSDGSDKSKKGLWALLALIGLASIPSSLLIGIAVLFFLLRHQRSVEEQAQASVFGSYMADNLVIAT